MQVTVFGASGHVGRRVVRLLLGRGDTVVIFVHRHNPFDGTSGVQTVAGDIGNPDNIAAALQGSDAVISCLGSWKAKRKNVLSQAMHTIIPAMEARGVQRIISLTGADAAAPREQIGGFSRLLRPMFILFAGKILRDGEEDMRLLAVSKLDWTVIRSPIMTRIGSVRYKLYPSRRSPFATIHRQAVAQALVDQLARSNELGQAPIIYRR